VAHLAKGLERFCSEAFQVARSLRAGICGGFEETNPAAFKQGQARLGGMLNLAFYLREGQGGKFSFSIDIPRA
jgi:hypothetical protein